MGEGKERKQGLSIRDCDKWLSMTLTMKERFSCARREAGERPRQMKRAEAAGGECCLGGVQGVSAYGERHFKTQSTFPVSLNGIEAEGAHHSLPC